MKREEEREEVGERDGEGAPWVQAHLAFGSKPLHFLKIVQPFPQQGWQQGQERGLSFYGKKIPDPQGGAGPKPVVLDKAQPWGLGCDLVGFPGLGGPTFGEERAEVATLELQCRRWKGS